ncbi:MAG: DUF6621 family protein [Phocaeicola sp.]
MKDEIKFDETVLLLDAAYLDRVVGDLSKHFSKVLERTLPKSDLPLLLECIALDAGVTLGKNALQVIFLYDAESKLMKNIQPMDFEKELHGMAFQSQLGEFTLSAFDATELASREALFLETVSLLEESADAKRLVLVPSEEEYGELLPAVLNKMEKKEKIVLLGMNPLSDVISFEWEMLGYAILQSLGVKADEI